jgi:hypothetical protein
LSSSIAAEPLRNSGILLSSVVGLNGLTQPLVMPYLTARSTIAELVAGSLIDLVD